MMAPRLGHGDEVHVGVPGHEQGSALYDLAGVHLGGLVLLLAVPCLALVGHPRLAARYAGYADAPVERRVAVWALIASALAHLGLVPLHGLTGWSLAYAVGGVAIGGAAVALAGQRRGAAVLASVLLVGSVLTLAGSALAGNVPDQVAMTVKLVEVLGLLALWSARPVAAVAGTVVVAGVMSVAAWGAALTSPDAVPVGMVMPAVASPVPTQAEQAAADALYAGTVAALARWADPEVAGRDGFAVDGLHGTDFHADHKTWGDDGRILDPTRPETLVYADGDGGPVLLGAMFQMPRIGDSGPTVGGPLTVWHAHEQVCFGLLPPSLAGLTSPFGVCPAGSILLGTTNEMIHVWTVPGAPQRFGDLDDAWRKHYLEVTSPETP